MISSALRRVELGEVPVATPTGRLVGASGLLLEASCRARALMRGWLRRSWVSATSSPI